MFQAACLDGFAQMLQQVLAYVLAGNLNFLFLGGAEHDINEQLLCKDWIVSHQFLHRWLFHNLNTAAAWPSQEQYRIIGAKGK